MTNFINFGDYRACGGPYLQRFRKVPLDLMIWEARGSTIRRQGHIDPMPVDGFFLETVRLDMPTPLALYYRPVVKSRSHWHG